MIEQKGIPRAERDFFNSKNKSPHLASCQGRGISILQVSIFLMIASCGQLITAVRRTSAVPVS